jgi:hypothetical protein
MAIDAGAHNTYDEIGVGNREDLSDIINDVSPAETPLLTMMGRTKATSTKHEYLVDTLAAAADNKHLEGGDATTVAAAARTRNDNYCQILSKIPSVSGTQENGTVKAGIKSEMAYQLARRMKEIKKDLEYAMIGQSNVKVSGGTTTAREMASLDAYLVTNNQVVSPSSAPTGDGTDVSDFAGTNAAFTETILNAGLQSLYTNSGGASAVNFLCTAATKKVFSTFVGNATRFVDTSGDKKLVAALDIYVGDFHTVRAVPSRQAATGRAYIIDPEYIKLAELRKLHTYDLAKVGDSIRKQMIWECTLEVSNEKAHVMIGDLTT